MSEERPYGDKVKEKAETQAFLAKEFQSLKRIKVPLEKLMLDPNNPRLRNKEKIRRTTAGSISGIGVQSDTEKLMVDMNGRQVDAMYHRISREGLVHSLCILHVAELPGGFYVLGDGNTRVTAIRKINRDIASGRLKVAPEIVKTWSQPVEVVLVGKYDESDRDFTMVWSAIRSKLHVVGPKEWGAFQKAAFTVALRDSGLSIDAIKGVLGATRSDDQIKEMIAAYDLFQSARRNETYGDRIAETKFTIFKEIVATPKLRMFFGLQSQRDEGLNLSAQATPKRIEMLLKLMYPASGRAFLAGREGIDRLRALGDQLGNWEAAQDQKRNKRFLSHLVSIESKRNINEMADQFFARLRDIKYEEIETIVPPTFREISRLTSEIAARNKALATVAKLTKSANKSKELVAA